MPADASVYGMRRNERCDWIYDKSDSNGGDTIVFPDGQTHVVEDGETLSQIASDTELDTTALCRANPQLRDIPNESRLAVSTGLEDYSGPSYQSSISHIMENVRHQGGINNYVVSSGEIEGLTLSIIVDDKQSILTAEVYLHHEMKGSFELPLTIGHRVVDVGLHKELPGNLSDYLWGRAQTFI